jgi:hypothetical protein
MQFKTGRGDRVTRESKNQVQVQAVSEIVELADSEIANMKNPKHTRKK